MAKTASPADEGPYRLRSDGLPCTLGFLGDFVRGPALFTLYKIARDQGTYPNGPESYLIDVDDGVGARECCRFTDEPGETVEWNGSWKGDAWCRWIMKRARALIAKSANT